MPRERERDARLPLIRYLFEHTRRGVDTAKDAADFDEQEPVRTANLSHSDFQRTYLVANENAGNAVATRRMVDASCLIK